MLWIVARINYEVTFNSAISPEGNLFTYFLQKTDVNTVFYWKLLGQTICYLIQFFAMNICYIKHMDIQ